MIFIVKCFPGNFVQCTCTYIVHKLHFRDSTWNCDKCKADVGAVGTLLVSDDATNAAVDMLQGKAFCQDPGMGLSGDDIKTCEMYIGKYIPPIMKNLFGALNAPPVMKVICAEMFHLKCWK